MFRAGVTCPSDYGTYSGMTLPTTYSRQELYDRVWKTPMQQLAKEFGISDVGLAKICRRYDVPVPPRGYWAKKAHGKRVTVTPLPDKSTSESITIGGTSPVASPAQETALEAPELSAARTYEAQLENLIVVSDVLRRRHPLVRRTEDYLKSARANTRGILDAGYGCLDVSVSKAQIPRAMRIMEAILEAFERRGYALNLPPDRFDPYASPPRRQPAVKLFGESIEFGLIERVKQTRNPAKPSNKPLEYRPAYIFEPTGLLSLRSKNLYDGSRHRWTDSSGVKVEQQLNEFVVALVEGAVRLRGQRAYWAEQQRLEAVAAQRRAREAAKIRELETEVAAWQKSRQLRAYIAAVERTAKRNGPIESGSELDEWILWARTYADHVDPLHVDSNMEDAPLEDDALEADGESE
jgi:hypothetical protein